MFEDFGKMLVGLGQNVMKKTGEVTELAALHTKVLGKKKKMEDEFRALGKDFYEAHKDEITEFADHVQTINSLYTEIAALEEEIRVLKEKLPEDQKDVADEADFVDEDTNEEVQEAESEEAVVCEETEAVESEDAAVCEEKENTEEV